MKKSLILLAFAVSGLCTKAQENYTIKMNLKIDGLPAEYAGFAEQEMTNYYKGDKYKTEMTSMMGASTTAFDGNKLVSISEQMGEKSGFSATKAELDEAEKKKAKKDEKKPKVEITSDKKMIAGYECTKAIVTSTDKDKKEHKTILWFTEKLKKPKTANAKGSKSRGGMDFDFEGINGMPLEIEIDTENSGQKMKILISTSEVSTAALDDKIFEINTEGYKMLSYKEVLEKQKGDSKE
ncbi:MAG: DUF4412 domain-containing protein [Bacteroidetes bacterium]|nr:DUF4412 domain-containing protein [Bacteroidota bacterium]